MTNGTGRRRARRVTQPVVPATTAAPLEHRSSWTVMTGAPSASSSAAYGNVYPAPPYHRPDEHAYSRAHPPTTWRQQHTQSPSMASISPSISPKYREQPRARYSPYPSQSQTIHRKNSAPSGHSPSLDIPALSLRDRNSDSELRPRRAEQINLPPIHTSSHSRGSSGQSSYALPPISTLEHSRGNHSLSSAEVLRRLKMDDDVSSEEERRNEEQKFRARSMSTPSFR